MDCSPNNVGAHIELQRILKFSPDQWRRYMPPPDLTTAGLESFAEFGTPIVAHYVEADRLKNVRDWIAGVQERAKPRAVFMDTTTIAGVQSLIFDDEYPVLAPATLLDLANFVSAVVLNDQIFHLQSPDLSSLKLNEMIGGSPVLVEIPVDALDIGGEAGLLTAYWGHACERINSIKDSMDERGPRRDDANDISALWGDLFGVPGEKLDVFDSTVKHDYDSSGPGLVEMLLECSDRSLSMHLPLAEQLGEEQLLVAQGRLASECNHRYLFNKSFSNAIQLPYLPNTFRVPFQRWLYDRSWIVEKGLSLAPYLDEQYREMIAKRINVGATKMALPFFLTALLQRISKRGEFGEELAAMRLRAHPLRQKLADLESAMKNGDLREIDPLRKAIESEGVSLTEWLQPAALAGSASVLLTEGASRLSGMLMTALAVLAYSSQYSGPAISKLQDRLVRPERWFIQNLAQSAAALTDARGKITSLWSVREQYATKLIQQLNVLAQNQRL